jgi:hypothetical protein
MQGHAAERVSDHGFARFDPHQLHKGKVDRLADQLALVNMDVAGVKIGVGKIEHHLGTNGVPASGRSGAKKPTRRKPK